MNVQGSDRIAGRDLAADSPRIRAAVQRHFASDIAGPCDGAASIYDDAAIQAAVHRKRAAIDVGPVAGLSFPVCSAAQRQS